jgi:hypothetical protein
MATNSQIATVILAPFIVAAGVLCVAAIAKLRAPAVAASALGTLGLPFAPRLARGLVLVFAVGEFVLGAVAVAAPSRALAAVMACLYAGFAGVALVLHRRQAACGCFGATVATASPVQAALSAALALVCAVAAVEPAHGLSWIFGRAPLEAGVLVFGIGAAMYATVVAYTHLPSAWNAWSGR